jgi:hypothetical protein
VVVFASIPGAALSKEVVVKTPAERGSLVVVLGDKDPDTCDGPELIIVPGGPDAVS